VGGHVEKVSIGGGLNIYLLQPFFLKSVLLLQCQGLFIAVTSEEKTFLKVLWLISFQRYLV